MKIVGDIAGELAVEHTEDFTRDLAENPLAKIFCNCSKTAEKL
jgi:hypothetical protein